MQVSFDIVSIGKASAEIQAPTARIERVASNLGITPVGRINGIVHFRASDIELIADEINRSRS